jgi:DNA repair protein RadD
MGAIKMELRDYQQHAIDLCRQSFARGNKRIVLAAPTSFGKTVTAIYMLVEAAKKGKRAYFICDRIKLIEQTIRACESMGVEVGVIQSDHWMTDTRKPIQICSVHTLARKRRLPECDFIVVDECHTMYSYLKDLFATYSAVPVVGLSATPYSKGMGLHYQDLVVPITPRELLDRGWLTPIRYFGGRTVDTKGIGRRQLPTGGSDFDPKQLAKRTEDDNELTGHLINNWMTHARGRQTIAFTPSIKHSKELVERFREAGVGAEHIDGYMDEDEREMLFEAHDEGEFEILSCSRLLNTGFDSPKVGCIIDCFPTKSAIVYQQRYGRGIRLHASKDDCIVLDHAGNFFRHGDVFDMIPESLDTGEEGFKEERQIKEKDKKESKPRECPVCTQLFTGLRCPCGYEVSVTERLKDDETMLQELASQKKENREWTTAEKQRFYGELIFYARTRGFKASWAMHKYRTKFGVWPNKVNPAPCEEVSEKVSKWIQYQNIRWAKGKGKASA